LMSETKTSGTQRGTLAGRSAKRNGKFMLKGRGFLTGKHENRKGGGEGF
jgi:hypothetical protein